LKACAVFALLKVIEIRDVTPLKKRKIVEYCYHLLQVKSDSSDAANISLDTGCDPLSSSSVFLRAGLLVHIDSFLATHGPCGRLFGTSCM